MNAADWPRYHYVGTLVDVLDGDTFVAMVDRGGRDYWEVPIRLAGCNAPEKNRAATKAAALRSKARLVELLTGRTIYLRTHKAKAKVVLPGRSKEVVSIDRYVADTYVEIDGVMTNVSDVLVAEGLAVPFMVEAAT